MKKLIAILGFAWAVVCLLIILIMFPGLNNFSQQLAKLPFMKINPKFSGGNVVKTIEYSNYTVNIHEPVFAALIGKSSKGFVQLDWNWTDSIPVQVMDTIDYNMDNLKDFIIGIDPSTENLRIISLQNAVGEIETSTRTDNGWLVRVGLINEDK
jgi:hypothetical protein